MASGAAPPVHRSLSNIRTAGTRSPSQTVPSSPHTPLRGTSSSFGSPSTLRAEEDTIVIEFGSRKLRVGFAGDAVHKTTVEFGPEQQRRVGDFRAWHASYRDDWTRRETGSKWGSEHELWKLDLRGLDLGLVADKIERGLREAFTKYLLIDSRPRKVVFVLPPAVPVPLLSTMIDTIFIRFQSPYISLLSAPVMCAMAAGVRSALVVDLGWEETVVTSVYEYREVACSRSVRAGKRLVEQVHKLLAGALSETLGTPVDKDSQEHMISFEECEEVTTRVLWCKPAASSEPARAEGLATVTETDESEPASAGGGRPPPPVHIPLTSTSPPTTLTLPYDKLAEPSEDTFFESARYADCSWDDHEQPIPQLLFRHLFQLPLDVRALCMARIIFTGGCANVLGLRARFFDDLAALVRQRGWGPPPAPAHRPRPRPETASRTPSENADGAAAANGAAPPAAASGTEVDGVWIDAAGAANAAPEPDPVEAQLRRGRPPPPPVRGYLRAVDSLGAWAGASLVTQLKVAAVATVDRDLWALHGAAGASRVADVDLKTQQRQSMGAAGLVRASAQPAHWTLGAWGSV